MGKREAARSEAAFMRGDTGVDGGATEEKADQQELEQGKAREQFLRGRAYLGREFLTWLLWRSEGGEPLLTFEETALTALFTGRIVMKAMTGDVVELGAKGAGAPYSKLVREGLQRGLLVHLARLTLTHGERSYEVTLDAEFLDVRAARLPELLTEEEDDRLAERLHLTEQLSAMIEAILKSFFAVRSTPRWRKEIVPELKRWMSAPEGKKER